MFKRHRQKLPVQSLPIRKPRNRYRHSLQQILLTAVFAGGLSSAAQAVEGPDIAAKTQAEAAAAANIEDSRAAHLQQINQQFAATVVIPTYQTLAEQTAQLALAGAAFELAPTAANLASLQDAWLAAELTWAKSSAFEFGPVHSLGYGPAIASPLDATGVDLLLAQLTEVEESAQPDYLAEAAIHPSMKGLAAIAYVLHHADAPQENGSRTASGFYPAERVYLSYLTAEAQVAAAALLDVWQVGWNDYPAYATVLANAGNPDNAIDISTRSGTEEIIRGVINSLDVVVNEELPGLIAAPEQIATDNLDLQILNSTLRGIQLASQSTGFAELIKSDSNQNQQIQQSLETATTLIAAAHDQPQEPAVIAFALTVALESLQIAHTLLGNDVLPLAQE